jgi:hypothetical protein
MLDPKHAFELLEVRRVRVCSARNIDSVIRAFKSSQTLAPPELCGDDRGVQRVLNTQYSIFNSPVDLNPKDNKIWEMSVFI